MSDHHRLERRLMARFGEAIGDFGLVEPGDRILVGVSGGKDSWALLNLFFNGQTKAMPARLQARNGRHTVIRPLVYAWKDEITGYVRALGSPVVCCACPGCKDPTLQRHRMKRLLRELERGHPGLKRSLLGALGRVDLGSLPIPARGGARVGDRLPVLTGAGAGAAGMALTAALGSVDGTGPGE